MSDKATKTYPTRGRGSRGSRGGFRSRGDRRPDQSPSQIDAPKKYAEQLKSLQAILPESTDATEILTVLEELNGDADLAYDELNRRLAEAQFSEVINKKKRSQSKAKEPTTIETSTRSGRGKHSSSERGGRGRGERGRSTRPGPGRGGHSDARSTPSASIPIADSFSAWDHPIDTTPEQKPAAPSAAVGNPAIKTWASMFQHKPKPVSTPPASTAQQTNNGIEKAPGASVPETGAIPSSDISSGYIEVTYSDADATDTVPQTSASESIPPTSGDDSSIMLPPSKDQLTEDNVEHLPDVSQPAPIGTAASTVDSSRVVTPAGGVHAPASKQSLGYAATLKNASRAASYQRRTMEHQAAVVVPAINSVDRSSLQFGSLNLNGDTVSSDIDASREDAETRQQPPHDSPEAQPKTSFPPAPRAEPVAQEAIPKAAPGPPPAQAHASQMPTQVSQIPSQSSQGLHQYSSRFPQTESTPQKPYDSFGHSGQPGQSGLSSESYPSHHATAGQPSNEYPYYAYDSRHHLQFNNYTSGATATESLNALEKSYNTDTSVPSSTIPHHNQNQTQHTQNQHHISRFNENQHSGHTTPNPTGQQYHHQQQHQQQQQQSGVPYAAAQNSYVSDHPYYRWMQYYGQPYQNNQYGTQPNKQYAHGHGNAGYMTQPLAYESSRGTAGPGADSFVQGGFGNDYSRAGQGQLPGQGQGQHNASVGFGDAFGRSPSGFTSQTASGFNQQSGGQPSNVNEDSLKAHNEKAGGPSPSSIGPPGRSASTTNPQNIQGLQQQGPQGSGSVPQQQGFGNHSHMGVGQPGFQGLGGQNYPTTGYNNSGGAYGTSAYGNYSPYGRGWGGNNSNSNNYSH